MTLRAVVSVMGILNPQLRDLSDFKHKLWDHVQIISDFQLDIDSPYYARFTQEDQAGLEALVNVLEATL